jgi:hypothetical protein
MIVEERGLELLRGEPRRYVKEWPDGRRWQGRFCGVCATRMWGEPARVAQLRILRPGTLDDHGGLTPVAHVWTRSALPWVVIPTDVRRFEGQPTDDDLLALIEAGQGRRNDA